MLNLHIDLNFRLNAVQKLSAYYFYCECVRVRLSMEKEEKQKQRSF